MIVMMIVVLAFPLLKIFMPSQPFIKYMAGKIDVGLVAIIFAVIALLLDLAPQKEAIAKIPWNTIVMIAGAGMLIAVAVKAGTITMLSNWVGSNVPKPLIPIAFLYHRGHHELLQLDHRCCNASTLPAHSWSCQLYGNCRTGSFRLHGTRCTVQCH